MHQRIGSRGATKRELAAELAAVLAFSAGQNNDKIGAPSSAIGWRSSFPEKGRSHILRIVREIIDLEPAGQGTDIGTALEHFNRVMKKRSIAFLISDFQDRGFDDLIRRTARKHDLVALQLRDVIEGRAARLGWISGHDPESGTHGHISTGSRRWRTRYEKAILQHQSDLEELMAKSGIDHAVLHTDQPYVQPLMQLFDRRG